MEDYEENTDTDLVPSFIILGRLGGRIPGSKQHRQSFMRSLIIHTHLWTLISKPIQQMRYEKYSFSKFTTLIWFLALVFAIYKYIQQITCSLNLSNIRATSQTWPLPQHRPRACCQCLQVVVWKERNISMPSSYGIGLPDYSWCVFEILSINCFTDCLSSPIAMSVNVKQVFSQGCICKGNWKLNLVKTSRRS